MILESQKLGLLRKHYFSESFSAFKGTIFPTTSNKQGKYIPYYKKVKLLDAELTNHLRGIRNFAGTMKEYDVDLLAWDLDGKAEEREEIKRSVQQVLNLLHLQGLKTFTYESGGKGYHIEAKLKGPMDYNRLNKIARFVKDQFQEKGIKFIDRDYPCRAAYRLFGCRHYRTGNFSYVVDEDTLEPLTEEESWERLQIYLQTDVQQNSPDKLSGLEQSYFAFLKTKLQARKKSNKKPSVAVEKEVLKSRPLVSKDELMQIYNQGLNSDYRNRTGHGRYMTAFNLGRLFRYELGYNEKKAGQEIERWLRRHYQQHCNTSDYFGDDASSCIASSYTECYQETIDNCLNGYSERAIPFGKHQYKIDLQKAKRYLLKSKIDDQCFQAMTYLMKQCNVHKSMTIYQSYNQLRKGWGVGSSSTVKKILDKLYLNLVERIEGGNPVEKRNSLYRIKLPESVLSCFTD